MAKNPAYNHQLCCYLDIIYKTLWRIECRKQQMTTKTWVFESLILWIALFEIPCQLPSDWVWPMGHWWVGGERSVPCFNVPHLVIAVFLWVALFSLGLLSSVSSGGSLYILSSSLQPYGARVKFFSLLLAYSIVASHHPLFISLTWPLPFSVLH